MPKFIEVVIAKVLSPYIKAITKQHKLIEAHKLRMNTFEVMFDEYGENMAILKERATVVENTNSGNEGTSAIKVEIDYLKKRDGITKFHRLEFFLGWTRGAI